MSEPAISGPSMESVEDMLRDELAHGDVILATARPVLRHLLANDDHALFSDEVIARVRGMMVHIARQMLFALARQSGTVDFGAFAGEREEAIAVALLEDTAFLVHAHALTIEALTTERLSQRSAIDPVLSPLVQELTASSDEAVAGMAMGVLSAQARFMQQQRRMELLLNEMPERLFEAALSVFEDHSADMREAAEKASALLREEYAANECRIGQIRRLVSAMQHKATRALEVDNAGLSIFVTALAMASDQDRDTVVLSLGESHVARLALSLRAAGLGQSAVEEQFLYLHPDIELPDGFDRLRADRAAALLASAQDQDSH